MPNRDGSRFTDAGQVLAISYRDKEGDWLHKFEVPVRLLTNAEGDLVLLSGKFKFTRKTGFVDQRKRK